VNVVASARGVSIAPASAARVAGFTGHQLRIERTAVAMSRHLTAIALTGAMFVAFGSPSPAAAQLLGSAPPLAVPVTGSIAGGGNFVGTLSIQRFAVQGTSTVAVAMIAGTIVNVPGLDPISGMRANVALPVTVSAAVPIAYREGAATPGFMRVRQCGGAVNIQIGAGANVNVMGTQVTLNPAVIDVGANTGSLIGGLVCQVLGLVSSPTMLVGVLNQLLAQLVGLSGLGGGLLL
jgi:hypothetical protein